MRGQSRFWFRTGTEPRRVRGPSTATYIFDGTQRRLGETAGLQRWSLIRRMAARESLKLVRRVGLTIVVIKRSRRAQGHDLIQSIGIITFINFII